MSPAAPCVAAWQALEAKNQELAAEVVRLREALDHAQHWLVKYHGSVARLRDENHRLRWEAGLMVAPPADEAPRTESDV